MLCRHWHDPFPGGFGACDEGTDGVDFSSRVGEGTAVFQGIDEHMNEGNHGVGSFHDEIEVVLTPERKHFVIVLRCFKSFLCQAMTKILQILTDFHNDKSSAFSSLTFDRFVQFCRWHGAVFWETPMPLGSSVVCCAAGSVGRPQCRFVLRVPVAARWGPLGGHNAAVFLFCGLFRILRLTCLLDPVLSSARVQAHGVKLSAQSVVYWLVLVQVSHCGCIFRELAAVQGRD